MTALFGIIITFQLTLMTCVRGHGYLKTPPARNVIANSDYCPHCLNGGTVATVSAGGTLAWPSGQHGICGDPYTDPSPRPHEAGGKFYGDGAPVATYQEGQVIPIEISVTTNHNGRFMFSICKVDGATPQDEAAQLTQACLDEHILVQADVPNAQNPGEQWFYTTPGDPMSTEYSMWYQLPENLQCDGVKSKCILQWYWVSGNTCNPPNTPEKYKRPFNLPDCGSPGTGYPEEFWNCADIKIVPSGSKAMYSTVVQALGGINQLRSAYSLDALAGKGLKDKTMHEQAAATRFCTTQVNAYGMFADVFNDCQGYFVCQELGSWYFRCPPEMMFDPDRHICVYADDTRGACTEKIINAF